MRVLGPGGLGLRVRRRPGVTQNWGQIIKAFGPMGGANPVLTPFGEEGCNAHMYPNT